MSSCQARSEAVYIHHFNLTATLETGVSIPILQMGKLRDKVCIMCPMVQGWEEGKVGSESRFLFFPFWHSSSFPRMSLPRRICLCFNLKSKEWYMWRTLSLTNYWALQWCWGHSLRPALWGPNTELSRYFPSFPSPCPSLPLASHELGM